MNQVYRKAAINIGALIIGSGLASAATAQTIVLSSPGDFSGNEAIIDFEGLGPNGALVPIVNGVNFALDPSGTAPRWTDTDTLAREFGPPGFGAIDPASGPFPYDGLEITFPDPVNRVGFEMNTTEDLNVTISCLVGGVVVDSFTLGSNVGVYTFQAFESVDTFDGLLIDVPNSAFWRLDNLRYELSAPIYSCIGFDAPADQSPITVQKNRVIPLKAELAGDDGLPLTDADVTAPPVIQVVFSPAVGGDAIDVTSESLAAGQGTEGNAFEFSGGKWRYNLKTSNYTSPGTYTVSVISGDSSEYLVQPTCEMQFVID